MNIQRHNMPIGVFDSGIGGISVLAEMVRLLPGERFIYLADSANAPYGIKDCDCVRRLSLKAAGMLIDRGIKALVVACNTATSVAIQNIRETMDIPVIGMEPAVKPAVELGPKGSIAVMATPLTLSEEKFNSLYRKFNANAEIIPLPCPGLVELIESEAESAKIQLYLKELFAAVDGKQLSSVVLGCTHYCFVKREINMVLGNGVRVVDGNEGTVRHLEKTLRSADLMSASTEIADTSNIEFLTSGDSKIVVPMCQRFLRKALDN